MLLFAGLAHRANVSGLAPFTAYTFLAARVHSDRLFGERVSAALERAAAAERVRSARADARRALVDELRAARLDGAGRRARCAQLLPAVRRVSGARLRGRRQHVQSGEQKILRGGKRDRQQQLSNLSAAVSRLLSLRRLGYTTIHLYKNTVQSILS